jgi:flagellar biosynthesis protein FlhG
LTAVAPLPETAPRKQIWSLGGGKGGIGKSLLTGSLGWQLARMGKRVVLVDADLGGANLHTCLGLPAPTLTMGDFIRRRVDTIEEVAQETGCPGLRLISGASDFLSAANIKHQQKVRVLNRIRALDVDIVLIDLGAGTSFNILDFFLISDVGMLAVVPEPTSIENSYRFIKSALYRRLRELAPTAGVREIVEGALDQKNPWGIKSPLDLLATVEREAPGQSEVLKEAIAGFNPRFVVNQVRGPADIAIGHQLVTACSRHLGIQRRLFMAAFPHCRAAEKVTRLARALIQNDGLSLPR